ncbi:MBL fold metallo-hydrolase [Neobacillus drentensis]|uniref:MBL fold metallo-hydrolase n=1 Tax=Neobacillus drentensis TaxID=220684 RepID=UPI002861B78E|nr:MBL fold metallo-hydrolase [Neobacillus drentensis]MDR7238088.1 glyoxylase-like metal-dependent hydrolase (beta-lactamase superfamily II) [Neobacillus drentensis]
MEGLKVKSFTLGPLNNNSYVVTDDYSFCIVIDPGDKPEQLINYIGNLKVGYILLTHCHYDHISGLNLLRQYTDAPVVVHRTEADWLLDPDLNRSIQSNSPIVSEWPDILLSGNELIKHGTMTIKAIHTPGHTPGSTSFHINNLYLFTGDTLLAGLVGPTNLPFGDRKLLLESIKEKIFTLDDSIVVYPGHGEMTTIGFERRNNPLPNIKSFY